MGHRTQEGAAEAASRTTGPPIACRSCLWNCKKLHREKKLQEGVLRRSPCAGRFTDLGGPSSAAFAALKMCTQHFVGGAVHSSPRILGPVSPGTVGATPLSLPVYT